MTAKAPYTGPTGIRIIGDRLHIDGYPESERLVAFDTKVGRQLRDLRLHASALNFSKEALKQIEEGHYPIEHIVCQCLVISAAVKYFSVFGDNASLSPLRANKVFKNMPDAKECFEYWQAVRDKHIVHDESPMNLMFSALVLGPNGRLDDVFNTRFAVQIVSDLEHVQLLAKLVVHTIAYVEGRIEAVVKVCFEEAERLGPEGRAALPDLRFTVPRTSRDMGRSRDDGA